MNLPGSEARKKSAAYVLGVVALLALYYIYAQLWGGSSTAPAAPATSAPTAASTTPLASQHAAKTVGTTTASLDPTLHTERMRAAEAVRYDGTGRNIFSANSAPVAIPKPIQPARPNPVATAPQVPQGPPPPPPIDLRFCGYFAAPNGDDRQVILVHGDDVLLAKAGDIVLRRYKVLSVSTNSIQVEDLPNNNRQTLPLTN